MMWGDEHRRLSIVNDAIIFTNQGDAILTVENIMPKYDDLTSGIAEINGAQLYYEAKGTGHPLLLVHAGVADRLVREIPDCKKVLIPSVAHMLNMEKPDEFNQGVLDFLATIPS